MEEKDHIIRCSAESAIARWKQVLTELDNWMQAAKNHPQLQQDIISGLQHWHDGTRPPRSLMDVSTAWEIQDSIGWGIVFKGCITSWWREEQEQYLKFFKS